jgi:hypothetical protein
MNLCDKEMGFAEPAVISPGHCFEVGFSKLCNSYMSDEIPGYLIFKTRFYKLKITAV